MIGGDYAGREVFSFAGWRYETVINLLVDPSGQVVPLTPVLGELLLVLLRRRGMDLSYEVLFSICKAGRCGRFSDPESIIRNRVTQLRLRLDPKICPLSMILSVRGFGFRFSPQVYVPSPEDAGISLGPRFPGWWVPVVCTEG